MGLPTRFWLFPLAALGSLAIIILPVFGTISSTSSISMNPDGGYNVLIAFDPDSDLPDDHLIRYLSKMRFSFQVFSAMLHHASNQRFYIHHIEVLVPPNWPVPVEPATTQIYSKSQVRISTKHNYLRVDNPHKCGQPGNFINVPMDLFYSNSWNSAYGGSWKALLTQWVRYRYGAWEEHGYPGDDYFPYFYKHPGKTDQWTPNGCSDGEITGQFLNSDDNSTCDNVSEKYPSDKCRFFPNWDYNLNKDVTTSLMSTHWLESVHKFCDAENHNRYSPNRQNKYCDHKSIWEVIQGSSDYQAVTAPPPYDVTMLDLYTYTESEYPRLIVFLDLQNGSNTDLQKRINFELSKIFGAFGLWGRNVAKIVSFPPLDSQDVIKTEVEWNTMAEGRALFQQKLNSTLFIEKPEGSDFSAALLALLRDNSQVPNEVNFIVVHSSSDGSNNAVLENDILATLLENPKLRLNTIELGGKGPVASLKYLTEASGGQFAVVESGAEIATNVVPLINDVAARCKLLREPEPGVRFRSLYRGSLQPATSNIIVLPKTVEIYSELEILISSPLAMPPRNLFIQPIPASNRKPVSSLQVTSRPEWSRLNSSGRTVYSLRISEPLLANSKAWQIHYDFCSNTDCQPSIVHVFARSSSENKDSVEPIADQDKNVVLQVQTSAPNNNLDGSVQNYVLVLVTVSKSGQPLTDLKITATIAPLGQNAPVTSLLLTDFGNGQPDLESGDGVYTGLFVPEANGLYDIQVLATSASSEESSSKFHYPDQTSLNCAPNMLPGAVTACSRLAASATFRKQAGSFLQVRNLPSDPTSVLLRTTDLQGYFDNKTGIITLTFTSPLVSTSSRSTGQRSAAVFQADKIEDLLGPVHEDLRLQTYDFDDEQEIQVVRFRPVNMDADILYYAIQSIDGDTSSATSNLVAIHIPETFQNLDSPSSVGSVAAGSFEDVPKNLKLIRPKYTAPIEEGASEADGSGGGKSNVLKNPLALTAIAFGGILVAMLLVLLGIKMSQNYSTDQ